MMLSKSPRRLTSEDRFNSTSRLGRRVHEGTDCGLGNDRFWDQPSGDHGSDDLVLTIGTTKLGRGRPAPRDEAGRIADPIAAGGRLQGRKVLAGEERGSKDMIGSNENISSHRAAPSGRAASTTKLVFLQNPAHRAMRLRKWAAPALLDNPIPLIILSPTTIWKFPTLRRLAACRFSGGLSANGCLSRRKTRLSIRPSTHADARRKHPQTGHRSHAPSYRALGLRSGCAHSPPPGKLAADPKGELRHRHGTHEPARAEYRARSHVEDCHWIISPAAPFSRTAPEVPPLC